MELNALSSAIRERAQHFQAIIGAPAVVMTPYPTWTVVAGTPIKFQVSACTVFVNGSWLAVPQTTFTLANGDISNHRYDSLVIELDQPTITVNGLPQVQDTATPLTVAGVASGTPALPTLTSTQVQLAWVDVAPGATTASGCTLHAVPTQTSNTLIDLQNHVAASLLSGPVHGVQASAPGAATPNQLLLGGARGGTGALEPNALLFAGMMASAAQDGALRVTSNGNVSAPATDGIYLEAAGATGGGALNTRNVLRLTGPSGVALALLQLVASQVSATGTLDVVGALTQNGQAVVTTAAGKATSAAQADNATNATNALTATNALALQGNAASAFDLAGAAQAVRNDIASGALSSTYVQGGTGGGSVGSAPGAVGFASARVVMGNFSSGDVRGAGGLVRIPTGMASILGWGIMQNPADTGQATANSAPYLATSASGGNGGKLEIDWQFETGGGQGRVTVMYWALGS